MLRNACCWLMLLAGWPTVPLCGELRLPPPDPIALASVGVDVADMARAERFYATALGMRPMAKLGRPDDAVQEVFLGFANAPSSQVTIVLIKERDSGPPRRPAKLVFGVSNVQATLDRVRNAGYAVVSGPTRAPSAPFITAAVRDADGTIIELFSPADGH